MHHGTVEHRKKWFDRWQQADSWQSPSWDEMNATAQFFPLRTVHALHLLVILVTWHTSIQLRIDKLKVLHGCM